MDQNSFENALKTVRAIIYIVGIVLDTLLAFAKARKSS